ncbi:MAG: bifunctional riboflavin kinase/FAD synthetase [Legionellales bacterium]|nr:bifunctional riboflavin kinase/FAD synthetase [Legionellales bacterium]
MHFLHRLNQLTQIQHCVATIGNFDGLHLGHHAILQRLVHLAEQRNIPSVVILFEPTPTEFFQPNNAPARLTALREKLMLLKKYHLDYVVMLAFNHTLAEMSADDFIEKILHQQLNIQHLIVGDDFRFGHQRQGDFDLLLNRGKHYGFTVENTPTLLYADERISSTRIRLALAEDNFKLAETLLGRPYFMSGRVRHGARRGHTIGFPTANIRLNRLVSPLLGVFAVRVSGVTQEKIQGVVNIGKRPTVDGITTVVEVHLFNFNQTIYGQHITMEFCHKIRNEKKFASFELLQQQIVQDCEVAKQFFADR